MLEKIKVPIILIIIVNMLIFHIPSYLNEKENENIQYAKENLITLKERILIHKLLEISGYYIGFELITDKKIYKNKFKEKVYLEIYEMRDKKPNDETYVFCHNDEFIKIMKLFNKSVKKDKNIIEKGNEIFEFYRINC